MARSLYSPPPIYLDTSIVLTILITGCHASTDSEEMGGVIAGSVIACLIFVSAIAVIAYCIIKAQNSRKLKKQKMKQVNPAYDTGTRVLRKIPAGQRGYPAIYGRSDYMIGYQPPLQSPQISMVSRMATISHMPVERPELSEGFYSISRPRKAVSSSRVKSIGDRKSKHKPRSVSRKSESDAITRNRNRGSKYSEKWDEVRSQYILKKREDVYPEPEPTAVINGPYTLTSLFNQNQDPTGVYPKTEDTRTNDIPTTTLSYPSTYATAKPANEPPIVYPPKMNSLKINPSKIYSPEIDSPEIPSPGVHSPEIKSPDVRNIENKGDLDALHPDYPDYDLESVVNEEDVPKVDVASPTINKFSYAFTEELKQSSRFRASNHSLTDPIANPFSSSMKQVQFNPNSSPIETNQLNASTSGDIPLPPPLPPP